MADSQVSYVRLMPSCINDTSASGVGASVRGRHEVLGTQTPTDEGATVAAPTELTATTRAEWQSSTTGAPGAS